MNDKLSFAHNRKQNHVFGKAKRMLRVLNIDLYFAASPLTFSNASVFLSFRRMN